MQESVSLKLLAADEFENDNIFLSTSHRFQIHKYEQDELSV